MYKIVHKISHAGQSPLTHTIFINLKVVELTLQSDGLIGRIKKGGGVGTTSLIPEHSVATP